MDPSDQTGIAGLVLTLWVIWIVVRRHRQGPLKAASWLVVLGAVVLASEHAGFAMNPAAGGGFDADDHLRLHFFMSGAYTLVGLAVLSVVAFTLLREGRKAGWFTLFGALVIGGSLDLIAGGIWFQHGSPLYEVIGESDPPGFGWRLLYVYLLAWSSALVISYPSVFGGPEPDSSTGMSGQ